MNLENYQEDKAGGYIKFALLDKTACGTCGGVRG